jgi:hypothetical protein
MDHTTQRRVAENLLAGAVGAVIGGIVVLFASHAVPKTISRVMSGIMSGMMRAMGERGCNPEAF